MRGAVAVCRAADTGHVPAADILAAARALSSSGALPEAARCLRRGLEAVPADRDLGSALVRVLAWQQDFAAAERERRRWPTTDAPGWELAGDLAWYQGQSAAAAKAYAQAETLAPSAALAAKRSKALEAMRAPGVLPASADASKAALWSAAVTALRYDMPQGETGQEAGVEIGRDARAWYAGVHALHVTRRYPETALTDTPVRGLLGYRWTARQNTEISLAATPAADFSYARAYGARHELRSGPQAWAQQAALYASLGAERAFYPDEATTSARLRAGAYWGLWHGHLTLSQTAHADARRDHGVAGQLQYAAARVVPEVWAAAGRGDASRSYLIHAAQAPYRLAGAKVALVLGPAVKVFVLGEWRREERFWQRLLGGGAVWTF